MQRISTVGVRQFDVATSECGEQDLLKKVPVAKPSRRVVEVQSSSIVYLFISLFFQNAGGVSLPPCAPGGALHGVSRIHALTRYSVRHWNAFGAY